MINPPENPSQPIEPPPLRDPTDDADGNPDRMDTMIENGDPNDAAFDPRD